jgi:hypothetical protein
LASAKLHRFRLIFFLVGQMSHQSPAKSASTLPTRRIYTEPHHQVHSSSSILLALLLLSLHTCCRQIASRAKFLGQSFLALQWYGGTTAGLLFRCRLIDPKRLVSPLPGRTTEILESWCGQYTALRRYYPHFNKDINLFRYKFLAIPRRQQVG